MSPTRGKPSFPKCRDIGDGLAWNDTGKTTENDTISLDLR